MAKQAPYGTWLSPITAEAITRGTKGIVDVVIDRISSEVYHIESRPSEGGRGVLVHTATDRDLVGAGWNVRTMVQEYGGAPAIVHDGVAYFSHLPDGRVYRVSAEKAEEPEPVSPEGKPYRYSCLQPFPPKRHLLAAVLEDHTIDEPSKVETTLVIIDTSAKTISPLLSGADFYALPKFSPDGKRLAWLQWFHPDMPFDGGEVHVADIVVDEDGQVSAKNDIHVAGKRATISAGYHSWATNDRLIFTSDESGFVNPWKYENGAASPLFPEPIEEDFAPPFWVFHTSSYSILDEQGTVALFTALKNARNILYIVDLAGRSQPVPVQSPFVVISAVQTVSLRKKQFAFIAQKSNEETTIVTGSLISLTTIAFSVLRAPSQIRVNGAPLASNLISEPRPITLKVGPTEEPLHVVYYPPHNPEYSGTSIASELPPCVVNLHGGPTGYAGQGLVWSKQYFTSRGWSWLDVNYGGSSGYGRKYIERLQGKWGIVDVEDTVLAPRLLADKPYNLVDPKRLVVRGGSAGGYTVLATISLPTDVGVFAAATSLYGISDLRAFAEFTHKFESRYLDHLIGGSITEVPEVYKDRSPINHVDKIVVPLLLLQGDIDKVVPKGQADIIYNSIQARGGVVEYKLYEGEGHGWRKEPNLRDSLERELGFYERILGLKPTSGIE